MLKPDNLPVTFGKNDVALQFQASDGFPIFIDFVIVYSTGK